MSETIASHEDHGSLLGVGMLMVLWFYGVMFLWFYSVMVLWFYSFIASYVWCYGFMVSGFMASWLMVLWLYGFMLDGFIVLSLCRFHGLKVLWFYSCIVQWFYISRSYQMFISCFQDDIDPISKIFEIWLRGSSPCFGARLVPKSIKRWVSQMFRYEK